MQEEKQAQDFDFGWHWRIRSIRNAKNITQKELANATGIDQSYISKLERGEVTGTPENLLKIAKALDVTVSDLLGDAVREPGREYRHYPDPRAAILADCQAPEGLRDLAQDNALVEALKITPEEWRALASLKPPSPLSKEGYVQVLFVLRSAASPAAAR